MIVLKIHFQTGQGRVIPIPPTKNVMVKRLVGIWREEICQNKIIWYQLKILIIFDNVCPYRKTDEK